jgi:hypothetical protein
MWNEPLGDCQVCEQDPQASRNSSSGAEHDAFDRGCTSRKQLLSCPHSLPWLSVVSLGIAGIELLPASSRQWYRRTLALKTRRLGDNYRDWILFSWASHFPR